MKEIKFLRGPKAQAILKRQTFLIISIPREFLLDYQVSGKNNKFTNNLVRHNIFPGRSNLWRDISLSMFTRIFILSRKLSFYQERNSQEDATEIFD